MSKRLFIYCEGQTEEMFVERLLRNHLAHHGVKVERPELCATTLDPAGQRGGFVNWDAIEFDLKQTFAGDSDPNLRFTTLLDVYRMPPKLLTLAGFTGAITLPTDVEIVEAAIERVFNEPRFKAYLQRHELEALLLADLDALERVFHRHKSGLQTLRADISGFAHPEDINHGPTTHPAARLATAVAGYEDLKASNAYFVLAEAGLEAVRAKCPRFDAWLKHWEIWGMKP
ncbi:MAG: DUF4276 family protein [Akkermansiaceae bacterium]|jgi:hypothetical protein|nr:DUF4276 family protein [Akkermansiaceae bacterium]